MTVTTHHLNLFSEFFNPVVNGDKTFEIRRDKKSEFKRGDILVLHERPRRVNVRTGRRCVCEITYVLTGWGLQDGYACLGIKVLEYGGSELDADTAADVFDGADPSER